MSKIFINPFKLIPISESSNGFIRKTEIFSLKELLLKTTINLVFQIQ